MQQISFEGISNNFSLFENSKLEINEAFKKISKVAIKILKAFKNIITFPRRYLGSKTFSILGLFFRFPFVLGKHCLKWNDPNHSLANDLFNNQGYHPFDYQDLSPDEARDNIHYACAAAALQRNKHNWLEPFGYRLISTPDFGIGLENQNSILFDPDTGLKMGIYEKDNELLIAFGAFGSHKTQFNLDDPDQKEKSNALHTSLITKSLFSFLGFHPALFKKANKFVEALKKSELFKNKKITLTGQSLGGTIASYVALKQQIQGVALNAGPLGAGLQEKIGDENLQKADSFLTHIVAKGDCLANSSLFFGIVDVALSALGIRTPGNFGKKMHVPTIYEELIDIHYHILGALFSHKYPEHIQICKDSASKDKEISKSNTKELGRLIAQNFKKPK
jgi:hypothetical protein